MGFYKSRYTADDIKNALNNYDFTPQLVKTKDVGYDDTSDEVVFKHTFNEDAYKVRAVSGLYIHRFVTQSFEYRILTHYPTKYATPYDALFDYNDQIDTRFRGYKIWGTEPTTNGVKYWWVNSLGEYKYDAILRTTQFLSYTIEQTGG